MKTYTRNDSTVFDRVNAHQVARVDKEHAPHNGWLLTMDDGIMHRVHKHEAVEAFLPKKGDYCINDHTHKRGREWVRKATFEATYTEVKATQ